MEEKDEPPEVNSDTESTNDADTDNKGAPG